MSLNSNFTNILQRPNTDHLEQSMLHFSEQLLHRFRCRRHFLFQKDFARFIQNAVARPAIAEVHTNRELVSFENHVSILLFIVPRARRTLGAYRILRETGLLMEGIDRKTLA